MSASVQQYSVAPPPPSSVVWQSSGGAGPAPQTPSGFGLVIPYANAPNMEWVLDTQNTTLPTTGWIPVNTSLVPPIELVPGVLINFAAAPTTPVNTPGTYYQWAKDPGTGAYAVSDPFVIS